MTRPRRLVVVTGTSTEVGKTWVSGRLAHHLLTTGSRVSARKPVQSFAVGDERTDAHALAEATGESPGTVCPPQRWYSLAMAPPMAAAALGRPVPTLAELVSEVDDSWPEHQCEVGLVEGAGGVASPLAADGDTAELGRALHADLAVLVADAGLGTINMVRLSVPALAPIPVVVYLNRYDSEDALHRANREWLTADGFDVAVTVEELSRAAQLADG